jgi:hypothetical protein
MNVAALSQSGVDLGPIVMGAVAGGLAVLTLARRRRRSADARDGVFRCRIRRAGAQDGTGRRVRGSVRARWVHDVLVVERRLFRGPRLLPVTSARGVLDPFATASDGDRRVSLYLDLDDGSCVEVVADADEADRLGGPFLTAHATAQRAGGSDRP